MYTLQAQNKDLQICLNSQNYVCGTYERVTSNNYSQKTVPVVE